MARSEVLAHWGECEKFDATQELTVQEGLYQPGKQREAILTVEGRVCQVTGPSLTHGNSTLYVGATKQDLIRHFGVPKEEEMSYRTIDGVWSYQNGAIETRYDLENGVRRIYSFTLRRD